MLTMQTVPMASFLGAIISAKDNPSFIYVALQIVELLTIKLGDVYQASFQKEGVVFEIENLAQMDTSSSKSGKDGDDSTTSAHGGPWAIQQGNQEPSTPTGGSSSLLAAPRFGSMDRDIFATIPANLRGDFVAFVTDAAASGSLPTKRPSLDPVDANILRARVLLAKKLFEATGDAPDDVSARLDQLRSLVERLCRPAASEAELRDTLEEVVSCFSPSQQALSSFELLKSGLVDGLLDFVDLNGTISSADRRIMLFEAFTTSQTSANDPMMMLVKRLHESLGRLETFEVETAFGGNNDPMRSSSSSLNRIMRVRLQADEGQDIPKHCNLVLSIQAIAPLRALGDYLRPRIADANFNSASSISNLISTYSGGMPIPRATSSATARLLSALNTEMEGAAASSSGSALFATSAPEMTTPSATASKSAKGASAKAGKPDTKSSPARRRSARLEAQATEPATEETPAAGPSRILLSSSAPVGQILPDMPMDMDIDEDEDDEDDEDDEEDYTDEDFEAEVSGSLVFDE